MRNTRSTTEVRHTWNTSSSRDSRVNSRNLRAPASALARSRPCVDDVDGANDAGRAATNAALPPPFAMFEPRTRKRLASGCAASLVPKSRRCSRIMKSKTCLCHLGASTTSICSHVHIHGSKHIKATQSLISQSAVSQPLFILKNWCSPSQINSTHQSASIDRLHELLSSHDVLHQFPPISHRNDRSYLHLILHMSIILRDLSSMPIIRVTITRSLCNSTTSSSTRTDVRHHESTRAHRHARHDAIHRRERL